MVGSTKNIWEKGGDRVCICKGETGRVGMLNQGWGCGKPQQSCSISWASILSPHQKPRLYNTSSIPTNTPTLQPPSSAEHQHWHHKQFEVLMILALWCLIVAAEVLDALFLQLFKLTWGQSHGKERAWGAGHLVAVVAVCTECLCVCEREMDWHCWTCWVWRSVRWLNTHIQDSYMPCNGCYSQVM